MTTVLLILGILLALIGLIGCVVPIIPGPLISYLGLIFLSMAYHWKLFSGTFLIIMAVIALVMVAFDTLVPAITAKRYGASKAGMWGGVIGTLVGMFFFPPFGIFIGMFIGALVGEILVGREGLEALRVGWGIFVGNLAVTMIKLAYCGAVLFLLAQKLFLNTFSG